MAFREVIGQLPIAVNRPASPGNSKTASSSRQDMIRYMHGTVFTCGAEPLHAKPGQAE
jgi:hypothetical protein